MMDNTRKSPVSVAILGAAGAVGQNLAAELARRDRSFVAVGRSREKLAALFPGRFAAVDLGNAGAAAEVLRGVETAVYAVGVPYYQFELHPVLMRSAVEACRSAGVRKLIVVSSVYSYGAPRTARVREDHPREPVARKGKWRKEQEDIALAAGALVLRLPDFYGPFAEQSMATPVINAAFKNMAAPWIGPVDAPHEFIYLPDAAGVIADLCERDDLFGRAWNLGGAGTIAPRSFIEHVYAEVGAKPRIRVAGKFLLRVAGIFSSLMKELHEMYYLQATPVVLDDSALAAQVAIPRTPYAEGIAATIQFLRERGAQLH